MGIVESISTCLKKYVTFGGRASRSEYWFFFLFTLIISSIVTSMVESGVLPTAVYYAFSIALFLPGLAVTVRRLHDKGKSGFWIFIIVIPLIGAILLIIWLATKGDEETNKYGAPENKAIEDK